MLVRMRALAAATGTVASVTPQNWLYQDRYKKMRKVLLAQTIFVFVATLGPRAFESISGEVVNTPLIFLKEIPPNVGSTFGGLDANDAPDPAEKAHMLRDGTVRILAQSTQAQNLDAPIVLDSPRLDSLLKKSAIRVQGLATSDDPQFVMMFWELRVLADRWVTFRDTVEDTRLFGGCERILL